MKFHRLSLLLIVAFGLLSYSNSFQGAFQFDDSLYIVENRSIQDMTNIPQLFADARGLVMLTFALNYAVGGLNVFGYHLVNTGLHIFNAILLYFILIQILARTRSANEPWGERIAAFSALLFVVHPLHTQAVSYIMQRFEIMASTFYLLGLLCFILAGRTIVRWKSILLFGSVFLFYLLGLKSKEIVVTLPAALLLYDFLFVSRKSVRLMLHQWQVHVPLGVVCVWFATKTIIIESSQSTVETLAQVGQTPAAGFAVQSINSLEYFLTQTNVLTHYLSLIIAPLNQNLDYDFPIAHSLIATPVANDGTILNFILLPPILAILFLGGLVAWAIWLARKDSHAAQVVSFCLLMYFIVLAPTSSFVPIADVIYEHRAYLASVFIIVPLVIAFDWLGGRVFERKKKIENKAVIPHASL